MTQPKEINIKVTMNGSKLRGSLPELGIEATGEDLWELIQSIKDELNRGFLGVIDSHEGQMNDFVTACIGDVEDWEEQARWSVRQEDFDAALVQHYPKLKDAKFPHSVVPSHSYDFQPELDQEELKAQDELMKTGPGPLWRAYNRKCAEWSYWEYEDRGYAKEKYDHWLDLGLDLRSVEALESEGIPHGTESNVKVIHGWAEFAKF